MNSTTHIDKAIVDLCKQLTLEMDAGNWNRSAVARICTEIRAKIEPAPWRGRYGLTDWLIFLIMLDFAQYNGQLDIWMSCRSMALECGYSETTVRKSFRRLVKARWLIPMTRVLRLEDLHLMTDANTYLINPLLSDRLVRNFRQLYEHYQGAGGSLASFAATSERSERGKDQEETVKSERVRESYALVGDTRRLIEYAPTERGVLLKPAGIMTALKLTWVPQTAAEIARIAGISYGSARYALTEKLSLPEYGLAVPDGKKWVRGIALDEWMLTQNPGIVAARTERYEQDREQWRDYCQIKRMISEGKFTGWDDDGVYYVSDDGEKVYA